MSQSLTPYLTVSNAAAAIDFYKKAFGAEEVVRHLAPDGKRLMHAHLKVLGMDLMLADDFPEHMGPQPHAGGLWRLACDPAPAHRRCEYAVGQRRGGGRQGDDAAGRISSGAIAMGSSRIPLDTHGRQGRR